jgi:hypothetical protein
MIKSIVLLGLAVGTALTAAAPASAAGGCGPGWHRGPYGGCRRNLPGRGPVVVAPGAPVVGVYYPGHGYWYGNRYWGQRYRWHGGWRYR